MTVFGKVMLTKQHEVKMAKQVSLALLFLMLAQASFAEQFIAKGRVFGGITNANPTELNDEMTLQNIKEFKSLTKYGVDITYALNSYLDVGFRYERINQKNLEVTATAGQDYSATLTQDAVMGVARTGFWKTEYLRADAFVGAGAANTKFSIVNSTQDGQLASGSYNSLKAQAGASVGAGYKSVFFFVEGGYEYNKVSSGLAREGNINNHVSTLDLSGSYIAVGLLFDGITGTK
jgi:hypothetical protein